MSVKLKIKVDKDCLEKSKFCAEEKTAKEGRFGQNCAIGRAIHKIFPNSWVSTLYINFFSKELCFSRKGHLINCADVEVDLPFEASNFIRKFDKATPEERVRMDEIEFEIVVPDSVIDGIGDIEEVKKIISSSKTLELV